MIFLRLRRVRMYAAFLPKCRYKEVVKLADVLDCDIVWVKRGNRR